MRRTLVACLCFCLFVTCGRKQDDYIQVFSNTVTYCNTVYELNTVVMGNNFSPMVASRNYAYAAIAGYEVIAGIYPDQYQSLAGQLNGLSALPKPPDGKKINAGFASILAFWKVGVAVTFSDFETKNYVDSIKQLAKDHGMPGDVYSNSVAYAEAVGNAIMDWSKEDHYRQTRGKAEFTVIPDSPGRWVPTPPAYSPAAEPHWNEIRTMVIDSVNEFLPPPAFDFNITDSTSPYYKEVKLIQHKGDSLSTEEAFIADFWDDNPFKLNVSGHLMFGTKKFSPPGHWMSITGIAARKTGADFNTAVAAYAKTGIALFDGFIQCWNIKYKYNTVRPETVINKYFDASWRPHLQTPPFPEYTCGHCYISACAAEVLTSVFGDNMAYTDTTEENFGIGGRSFRSFRHAADEVKMSRFYGGIHYQYSVLRSHDVGQRIGDFIAGRLTMKKH